MGVVDAVAWECVLCGCHIQNDWASRATNVHQILCEAWTFLHRNCLDDSEGCSCGHLVTGSFTRTTHLLTHHIFVKSFLVKHPITQVTQPPYSPDLAPCDFWLFPKLKSPLKGERFQTIHDIQENTTGQLMLIGRIVWSPKVPALKGTEVSLSFVQCFSYLISSINVSIFHGKWLDVFWTDHTYIVS